MSPFWFWLGQVGVLKMNKTIMIIEDEYPFQELYAAILEDTDYSIIRAYDGGEALVELEEKRPDLIILDLFL